MLADSLRIKVRERVYEPREDSHMLADSVEKYAFGKTLDMGTGSGIQGIVAAKKGCSVTFCDINPMAIECAKENARSNDVQGKFIVSDLFDNVQEAFDTIVFNPPYLLSDRPTDVALDGGKKGREIIDRFLDSYKRHVNEKHVVLLLESSMNDYANDVKKLSAKVVGSERYFFEELVVLLF